VRHGGGDFTVRTGKSARPSFKHGQLCQVQLFRRKHKITKNTKLSEKTLASIFLGNFAAA